MKKKLALVLIAMIILFSANAFAALQPDVEKCELAQRGADQGGEIEHLERDNVYFYLINENKEVYRATIQNFGTWGAKISDLPLSRVNSLTVSSVDGELYVSGKSLGGEAEQKVYMSVDSGETWAEIATFPSNVIWEINFSEGALYGWDRSGTTGEVKTYNLNTTNWDDLYTLQAAPGMILEVFWVGKILGSITTVGYKGGVTYIESYGTGGFPSWLQISGEPTGNVIAELDGNFYIINDLLPALKCGVSALACIVC